MSATQFTTASVPATASETSALVRTCARIADICFNAEEWQPSRRDLGTLYSAFRDAIEARDCDAMRAALALWEAKPATTRARHAVYAEQKRRDSEETRVMFNQPRRPSIEERLINSSLVSLDAYRAQHTTAAMR